MVDILNNIRKLRESKGYSQEVMADLLEITQPAYARFERGVIKTDLKLVQKIADLFDLSLFDLFAYPDKVFILKPNQENPRLPQEVKTTVTIEIGKEKKEQVFRYLFGVGDMDEEIII